MSLPFLAKKPIDLPPIVSVELIQITEKTNIPFAPKAKKIIEEVKEKDTETQEIIKFNDKIQRSERVENVLMPIRDGLMVCRKIK